MKKIFLLFMGLVLFSDYAFADKNIELKTNESPVSVSQNQILLMRHNLLRLLIFYF